jgi:hypothetical protein
MYSADYFFEKKKNSTFSWFIPKAASTLVLTVGLSSRIHNGICQAKFHFESQFRETIVAIINSCKSYVSALHFPIFSGIRSVRNHSSRFSLSATSGDASTRRCKHPVHHAKPLRITRVRSIACTSQAYYRSGRTIYHCTVSNHRLPTMIKGAGKDIAAPLTQE